MKACIRDERPLQMQAQARKMRDLIEEEPLFGVRW